MFYSILGLLSVALMLYLCIALFRYPHLRRMALRNIAAQKHTSLLTMLGLTTSTALISMTLVLNGSMNYSMNRQLEQHFGNIAYDVPSREQPLLDSPFFESRHIAEVRQSGGVLPVVSSISTVIKKNGNGENLLVAPNLHILGTDRREALQFDPSLTSILDEDLLQDELLLSESAADRLEAKAGEFVYVLDESNREHRLKVKKVVQERGLTGYQGIQNAHATIIVNLDNARSMAGMNEKAFTNLLLTEQSSQGWIAESVRSNAEKESGEAAEFITIIFGMTSINAVLIGIVLITNIFKLIAEERRKEMGVLQALGLGKGDLKKLLKMEGLLYGAFSGLIGVSFGCGLAFFLITMIGGMISELFTGFNDGFRFYARPGDLISGFSIGLLIIFLCVWGIARKSVKISVVQALQSADPAKLPSKLNSLKLVWSSVLAGLVALSFIAVTAVPDFRRELITDDRIPLVFIAILLSVPLFVYFLIQWLHHLCEGILIVFRKSAAFSLIFRLAFRNMNENRVRTGLILLMLAAISCFISFPLVYQEAMKQMMERADPKSSVGGFDLVARDPRHLVTEQLERQMRSFDFIQDHSQYQLAAVPQLFWKEEMGEWGLFDFKVNGIDLSFAESNEIALVRHDGRFSDDREVWRELARNEDTVILAENTLTYAKEKDYDIGDRFPIQIGDKTVSKEIIGIAQITGFHPESFGIWTNRNVIAALAKSENDIHTTLFIKLQNRSNKELEKGIEKTLNLLKIPQVVNIVESESGWYIMGMFIMRLFQNFNVIALSIGMIGLMVVMYRLILQRRQQLGMLRAVGMPPGTLFWSVLTEGAFIGVFGISLGYLIGTYMSYVVFDTLLSKELGNPLVIPFRDLLLYFSGTLLITSLFACLPARKVLRVSPVEAARYAG